MDVERAQEIVYVTQNEVAFFGATFGILIVLFYAKAYFSFLLLKREKGYFFEIDSFFHLLINPLKMIENLSEVFEAIYTPIFFFKKGDNLRNICASLCYAIPLLIFFLFSFA